MTDVLPIGLMISAKVHPCNSTETALENCLFYNPGYAFKDCCVMVQTGTEHQESIRMKYSREIPLSTLMAPMILRAWYSFVIDQLITVRVVEEPETLNAIRVQVVSDSQPVPTLDRMKELLDGLHLATRRPFYIQNEGILYKLEPTMKMVPFQGVFDKKSTIIVVTH